MADITKNPIFTDEAAARAHLEASALAARHHLPALRRLRGRHFRCPEDQQAPQADDRGQALQAARGGRYYCKDCEGTFTVTVGTVMEDSHIPLNKWLYGLLPDAVLSKKGISSHQLHRTLGRHATRPRGSCPIASGKRCATGSLRRRWRGQSIVEADETFIGRKEGEPKGKQRLPPQDRGADADRPHERRGPLASTSTRPTRRTSCPSCAPNIAKETAIVTDEATLLQQTRSATTTTPPSTTATKEWVAGEYHTNTVEGYFSIFKRGMKGVYQHCSEKHLHRYLAEFDFRYSNRVKLGVDDEQRAARMVKGVKGKRLTYRTVGER